MDIGVMIIILTILYVLWISHYAIVKYNELKEKNNDKLKQK